MAVDINRIQATEYLYQKNPNTYNVIFAILNITATMVDREVSRRYVVSAKLQLQKMLHSRFST